ncbi:cytochrome c oxidase subunit II [Bosea sp. CS1GBMeth4]|uniref:cytochrome c oxidase subunit II n=1 Tax=Bosea sp. CS1GBMeth4 TaxID=1892849 RepID=UPI0016483D15|nr:cytochrome c oxidase subunit II [Bosea sp. CS1GBMeth4]
MRLPVAISALLALAACTDRQSVMAAHGPEAGRVALLAGIVFAGAAVIMLVVMAALWVALRGSESQRAALAGETAIRIGGIAFPAITLSVLLGYGLWLMRDSLADAPPALRIEVTGEQWWWRLRYRGGDGAAFAEANEIRIPVGAEVEFELRSADVIHSFWVPSLGGKLDMIPGRTNRLRLRAERAGVYRGQCAEYCGGPHALMALEIIAMPQAEFAAWLTAGRRPAPAPAGQAERRGAELFLAAGCGGCHAIRGTAAEGAIGPDLSRVGGRRFLAAATIPAGRENLARFIAHGQDLKPGNLMPPFRLLAPAELDALAAYLVSLR